MKKHTFLVHVLSSIFGVVKTSSLHPALLQKYSGNKKIQILIEKRAPQFCQYFFVWFLPPIIISR